MSHEESREEEQMQEREPNRKDSSNPVHGPLTFQQQGAIRRGGSGHQEPQTAAAAAERVEEELEERERGQDGTGQARINGRY
jgi:hypothetical protein